MTHIQAYTHTHTQTITHMIHMYNVSTTMCFKIYPLNLKARPFCKGCQQWCLDANRNRKYEPYFGRQENKTMRFEYPLAASF